MNKINELRKNLQVLRDEGVIVKHSVEACNICKENCSEDECGVGCVLEFDKGWLDTQFQKQFGPREKWTKFTQTELLGWTHDLDLKDALKSNAIYSICGLDDVATHCNFEPKKEFQDFLDNDLVVIPQKENCILIETGIQNIFGEEDGSYYNIEAYVNHGWLADKIRELYNEELYESLNKIFFSNSDENVLCAKELDKIKRELIASAKKENKLYYIDAVFNMDGFNLSEESAGNGIESYVISTRGTTIFA
jgi:hypothetical protein